MSGDRHLRSRFDGDAAAFDNARETHPEHTPSFRGETTTGGSYPTTAGVWFLVHPVEMDGDQSEGAAPTFTPDTSRTVPVLVLGSKAPALGSLLEAFAVGGVWVAETGCGGISDSCPDGGTLCVDIGSTCPNDGKDYTVVVTVHGSTTVVATGTTTFPPFSNVGTVCFTLPVGSYDVTATKTGCDTKSWTAAAVTCGDTTTLAATAACASNSTVVFSVTGCNGAPLPDAAISYTGPDSGTLTTDGAGKASFVTTKTGSWSYTVTHPSGRFLAAGGTFSRATACTGVIEGVVMLPASGYTCCGSNLGSYWPTPNPYPIPVNLFITDGKGFTMPFTLDSNCSATPCDMRDMDDASPSTPITYPCTDGNPGSGFLPPPDIGTYSTSFYWDIRIGPPGTMVVRQHYPVNDAAGLGYVANGDVTGVCAPLDTRRMWRLVKSCAAGNSFTQYSTTQATLTVNSVYPLNISVTFTAGPNGFGPVPYADPVSGVPYTLSAVIHE